MGLGCYITVHYLCSLLIDGSATITLRYYFLFFLACWSICCRVIAVPNGYCNTCSTLTRATKSKVVHQNRAIHLTRRAWTHIPCNVPSGGNSVPRFFQYQWPWGTNAYRGFGRVWDLGGLEGTRKTGPSGQGAHENWDRGGACARVNCDRGGQTSHWVSFALDTLTLMEYYLDVPQRVQWGKTSKQIKDQWLITETKGRAFIVTM